MRHGFVTLHANGGLYKACRLSPVPCRSLGADGRCAILILASESLSLSETEQNFWICAEGAEDESAPAGPKEMTQRWAVEQMSGTSLGQTQLQTTEPLSSRISPWIL